MVEWLENISGGHGINPRASDKIILEGNIRLLVQAGRNILPNNLNNLVNTLIVVTKGTIFDTQICEHISPCGLLSFVTKRYKIRHLPYKGMYYKRIVG